MRSVERTIKKHSLRCEYAKPDSRCRCKCGGRFHAAASQQTEQQHSIQLLTEAFGGEIADFIKAHSGRTFFCRSKREHSFFLHYFIGYPHDQGLIDKDGNRWWLYHACPHCNYQWPFWKIEDALKRQKKAKTSVTERQIQLISFPMKTIIPVERKNEVGLKTQPQIA